jgi:hypothetical protein
VPSGNVPLCDLGCQMAFFRPKILIWIIFEGLAMKDEGTYIVLPFGLFYGLLVYFMRIWSILRPFGIFYWHLVYVFYGLLVYVFLRPFGIICGHLVYFQVFWYFLSRLDAKKNLATLSVRWCLAIVAI